MSLARITVIILVLMGLHFSIAFTARWYDMNYKEKQEICGVVTKKYQILVKAKSSYYDTWIEIKDIKNNMYDFYLYTKIKKQIKTNNIGQYSNVCIQFVHSSYRVGYFGEKKIDKWLLKIEKIDKLK